MEVGGNGDPLRENQQDPSVGVTVIMAAAEMKKVFLSDAALVSLWGSHALWLHLQRCLIEKTDLQGKATALLICILLLEVLLSRS